MSAKKAWVLYTLLRLVFFAVPLAVILLALPRHLLIGLNWGIFFAVGCAAVISLALSLLFLSGLRHRAAQGIEDWRMGAHKADAAAEDKLISS